MGKKNTQFQCNACGATTPKWQGQCPDCGEWNTLEETIKIEAKKETKRNKNWAGSSTKVINLSSVGEQKLNRISSGIPEFDQVLGGSIVAGSVVLFGGDPGIGKSTLLLQVLLKIGLNHKVLYVTGEESVEQIKERANRISDNTDNVFIVAETDFDAISAAILSEKPSVVIVDSIQTISSSDFDSAPGTVTQVRECASYLTQIAKQTNTAMFLVGHVTKEGNIAGPRVLEHIVDAVISFEGNKKNNIRLLKPHKNRFGSVNEVAAFILNEKGMTAVSNPSTLFLNKDYQSVPGSCLFAMQEGRNCLFLEVQSLIDDSQSHQKILTVGTEYNRTAMVMAVLYKKLHLDSLSLAHIYVNAVGGIRIDDTGVDLAVACAAITAIRDKALPDKTVVFGEIGLTGEVRSVVDIEQRLKEIADNGFQTVIMPNIKVDNNYGLQLIKIKRVEDLLAIWQ